MSSLAPVTFALLIATVIYILCWIRESLQNARIARQYGCGSPTKYPHKDPLGIDLFLKTATQLKAQTRLKGIKDMYDSYGSTFQTKSFGSTVINTIDPANIQAFLALDFTKYGLEPIRFPVASPIMGRSIFTSDGPLWEKARSEVKPVFARGGISNMANFERHLDRMIDKLTVNGSLFDIAPTIDDLFLADSLDYLFAQSTIFPGTDHSSLNARFLKSFRAATAGAGRRHLWGKLKYVVPDPSFKQACKELHQFVDLHVDAALEYLKQNQFKVPDPAIGHSAFLLDLVAQTQERLYLRNQLLAVFMAGHESTAVLVEDAMFELARHPVMWSKARAEALSLSGQPLSFESVRSQSYIYQVIKEGKLSVSLHILLLHTNQSSQLNNFASLQSSASIHYRRHLHASLLLLPLSLTAGKATRPSLSLLEQLSLFIAKHYISPRNFTARM